MMMNLIVLYALSILWIIIIKWFNCQNVSHTTRVSTSPCFFSFISLSMFQTRSRLFLFLPLYDEHEIHSYTYEDHYCYSHTMCVCAHIYNIYEDLYSPDSYIYICLWMNKWKILFFRVCVCVIHPNYGNEIIIIHV